VLNPEQMADAVNGLPQIAAHWATHCGAGVYVGSNLGERERMQNQQSGTEPKVLRPSPLPIDMLANPKVVLMAVGFLGLALDLFVRPISPTGLALLLLAATPWILQAWALRAQPAASNTLRRVAQTQAPAQASTRAGIQEQRNDTSGQKTSVSKPERPSQPAAENVKKVHPAEAAARQLPRRPSGSELERRPVSPRSSEIQTSPPRTA
jgi:hypothetical protein